MKKFRDFFEKHYGEIMLLLFTALLTALFFDRHANITTDLGREALIPSAVLHGEVLYRDILNIYGPFSYYLNAVIYFLFGENLSSLNFIGSINALVFAFTVYCICKEFFSKNTSVIFTAFIATVSIYNIRLYNMVFPYAFAASYGLSAYSLSVLFLMKFLNSQKQHLFFFATMFAGISFACKPEFFTAGLIAFIIPLFYKKLKTKEVIYGIIAYCSVPLITYLIPVIQGITLDEIKAAFRIFIISAKVPSVVEFGKTIGMLPSVPQTISGIAGTVMLLVFLSVCYIGTYFTKKSPVAGLFLIFVYAIAAYFLNYEYHFSLLAVLVLISTVIKIKDLIKYPVLLTVTAAGLCASIKTFFALNLAVYGSFSIPLLLIAAAALLKEFLGEKFATKSGIMIEYFFIIVLSAYTVTLFVQNITMRNIYSFEVRTDRGTVYTEREWADVSSRLLRFTLNNTSANDKILVLPEGAMFNFLANRKTDMNLYALNRPYFETYGEDNIINKIKNADIKYIIIITGMGLYEFNQKPIYLSENKVTDFIRNNYKIVYSDMRSGNNRTIVLQRNN